MPQETLETPPVLEPTKPGIAPGPDDFEIDLSNPDKPKKEQNEIKPLSYEEVLNKINFLKTIPTNVAPDLATEIKVLSNLIPGRAKAEKIPDGVTKLLQKSQTLPLELIGEGGLGTVYRALQIGPDREVALKLISPKKGPSKKMIARFEREYKALAQFDHPNIAKIYDAGLSSEGGFMAQQLLKGEDLDHYLKRHNQKKEPVSHEAFLPIALGTIRGLEAVHKAGIIHRDIKPSNIFLHLEQNGEINPKLIDFGLTKSLLENDSTISQGDSDTTAKRTESGQKLSSTGHVIGTPNYASPEQLRAGSLNEKTDIYSLGATFYELLQGRRLTEGLKSVREALEKTKKPLNPLPESLPDNLKQLIYKMLDQDPTKRPTATDVKTRLERMKIADLVQKIDLEISQGSQIEESTDPSTLDNPNMYIHLDPGYKKLKPKRKFLDTLRRFLKL